MADKQTNFELILEFNRSFGVPIYSEKQLDIFEKNPKLVEFRVSLINEEIQELTDAVKNKDFVEIIDALTDIEYVVLGAYVAFGINADTVYNLDKQLDMYDDYCLTLTHTVQKDIFNTNPKMLNMLLTQMQDKLQLLKDATAAKNFDWTIRVLTNIRYVTMCMYVLIGIDPDEAFEIVHSSNMSKLCSSEEQAKETVEWYLENEKRYDSPKYRLSDCGKYWVIFNESTSKILKNKYYTAANFDSLLNTKKTA